MRHPLIRLAAFALCAGAVACSSSNDDPGRISVRLVDAPADYAAINLDVRRVEIQTGEGTRVLGEPGITVNLLSLVNGVAATLVEDVEIAAGRYSQLRLVLGPNNSVQLQDGTVHPLTVPSGMQSGVKLTTSFEVLPNTTADVFIDFDAHRSIFVHQTGNSARYILRPTVRAVDRVVTGAITGTVREGTTPLPGVEVTAQTFDPQGNPVVVRSTVTGSDGAYVLDLLPVNTTYFVVSQAVVRSGATPVAYAAEASGPILVSDVAPLQTFDGRYERITTPAPGSLTGSVSPVALATDAQVDADIVAVIQALDAGAVSRPFIVRTAIPQVVSGAETYEVDALPAGDYSVRLRRLSTDAQGNESVLSSALVPVSVVSAPPATTADLTLLP